MKILIIGVGSIGSRHFRNLLRLGYKNIILCDPDVKKLNDAVLMRSVPIYQNVKIALKVEKPEVVFICSPTQLHLQFANLALDCGSDIFIEKPISESLNGINRLIKKTSKKNKIVMVACNFRFHQSFKAFKKIIDNKKYGEPLTVRLIGSYYLPTARKNIKYQKIYASQKSGGGVVLDSGSHVLDYLQSLFGKVEKAFSIVNHINSLGIKSEEAAHLIFRHNNGVITAATIDYISKKRQHIIEVATNKGLLTLDFIKGNIKFENGAKITKIVFEVKDKKHLDKMYLDEINYFFNCLKFNKQPIQGIIQAKKNLEILLKLKQEKLYAK